MQLLGSFFMHLLCLLVLNFLFFSSFIDSILYTILISFLSAWFYDLNQEKYPKFHDFIMWGYGFLATSTVLYATFYFFPGKHVSKSSFVLYLLCSISIILFIHVYHYRFYLGEIYEESRINRLQTLHGTARFATKEDIPDFLQSINSPFLDGTFLLGPSWDGTELIALPRQVALQHGIILGGTGTGKSRGYYMPNCVANQQASYIATDPKSELWQYTSGFHLNPIRYAPTEPDSSACFNWIPLCNNVRFAQLCARAIIEAGNNSATEQFWIEAETAYLAAVFSHTSTLEEPTPLTAFNLITTVKQEDLINQLLQSPSKIARGQANIFNQTNEKIKGAIVPAVAANLQFLFDDDIARFTSASLEPPRFGQLRVRQLKLN